MVYIKEQEEKLRRRNTQIKEVKKVKQVQETIDDDADARQLKKSMDSIHKQMQEYITDMEIRGKYGELEKKVVMLGNIGF